jgi:hypothetical protein
VNGDVLVDRDGRWRQQDLRGTCLWPRTFHDDHGVTHAVLLAFDNRMTGPVLMCTGHRAHRTGVDEDYKPITCLACIVKNPQFPVHVEVDDDG